MNTTRREVIMGFSVAFGGALAYAVVAILAKVGLGELAPPLVGATMAMMSGTLVLGLMEGRRPDRQLRQKKRGIWLMLAAGVAAGLGVTSNYYALSIAPVVLVAPLAGTSPLVVLVLSHLFLGHLENINLRLVLGTLLVVVGVTLITLGRGL
ncbi:MAG: EamA family transporter [Chloroflexota bacterium]